MTLSPRYERRSRSPGRNGGRREENSSDTRTWKHFDQKTEIKREVRSRSPSPRGYRGTVDDNSARETVKREPIISRNSHYDEVKSSHHKSDSSRNQSQRHKAKKVKKEKKKHKKHRSKRRSSSSSSSSAESDDGKLQERLELERQRLKAEKLKKKERIKSMETPEEKRARRLAKKLAKENKKKTDLGWDDQHMNYSNLDNPFNDAKLTETFVWSKKLEKDGLITTLTPAEIDRTNKDRIIQNKAELDKAFQRRQEREAQREEQEMMQRQNESEQYKEWEKMEDQFHLQQSRIRSQIRIKERRAKAIDLLARYINAAEDEDVEELDVEMHEPYNYLNGLNIRDLEDLLEDIRTYRSLERGKNDDYWKDLTVIAEEELSKLRKVENPEASGADRREGIHGSVRKDVSGILKGKNHQQLALLETEILRKIKGHEEGVDVGYWESLLGHLKAHMARARLRDRHQETLKRKLRKLKEEQGVKQKIKDEDNEEAAGPSVGRSVLNEGSPGVDESAEKEEGEEEEFVEDHVQKLPWESMSQEERELVAVELYESGRFSPMIVKEEELPPGTEILDPTEDERRQDFARNELKTGKPTTSQTDAAMVAEAKKGMGEDERSFASELPLEQHTYLWSDKYRPRKPRYFNRVHTGFEWNKYNQTHYDLDNPPPKIVQGYKFNVFYPDLLDPNGCPEFVVIPCDDPDFAVLKIKAGPPYEDIAFKIVNREWEDKHNRGYCCQFANGIFKLWFHFKKYRYRR